MTLRTLGIEIERPPPGPQIPPRQPDRPPPLPQNPDQKDCEQWYRVWVHFNGETHGQDQATADRAANQALLALRYYQCLPGCAPVPECPPAPECPEAELCPPQSCPPCEYPVPQDLECPEPDLCPPVRCPPEGIPLPGTTGCPTEPTTGTVSYWWILAVSMGTWYLASGQPKNKRRRR